MREAVVDLVIVGGGPAGQAAAAVASNAGLSVLMYDEQAQMGGQILRQPPAAMRVAGWLPGRAYRRLKVQLARARDLEGVEWRGRRSVTAVFPREDGEPGYVVLAVPTDGGDHERVVTRRLLVAAGCYDLPFPIPGWTLPGVTSAGALQAFVKSQQLVSSDRLVLAGTHPLQLILADQIQAAGGKVAMVLFAQSFGQMARGVLARPYAALRHVNLLLEAAAAFMRVRKAGTPIRFGWVVSEVEGRSRVEAVRTRTANDQSEFHPCERVALCFGFTPQTDLPRALGASARVAPGAGGWAILADGWGRTDRAHLYVAGETTGVSGALGAMEEGHLAGLAIAIDTGKLAEPHARRLGLSARRRIRRINGFARLIEKVADPTEFLFSLVTRETIVCRCEGVTRAQIEEALSSASPPGSPSAVKLITRAGMGLCQGRNCEHIVRRLVSERDPEGNQAMGGYTPRMPVRPAPIGSLAAG